MSDLPESLSDHLAFLAGLSLAEDEAGELLSQCDRILDSLRVVQAAGLPEEEQEYFPAFSHWREDRPRGFPGPLPEPRGKAWPRPPVFGPSKENTEEESARSPGGETAPAREVPDPPGPAPGLGEHPPPRRSPLPEGPSPEGSSALSGTDLVDGFRRGDFTCREVLEACLEEISNWEPGLGAVIEVFEEAEERAAALDRLPPEERGPLHGVPVLVKDNICIRGKECRCGSLMLEGYRAPWTATALARLEAAGAVLLGRTNMDEFAFGSSTGTSCFGKTRNPWNPELCPGGSSGGTAAAVAAGLSPLGLGSDTGGSIRQPAALCGITGFKPTRGRVSRDGLVAFASSLDGIGPMSRGVSDLVLSLGVLEGPDPRDLTTLSLPPLGKIEVRGARPLDGIRIGLPREHFGMGLPEAHGGLVLEAARIFEEMGATCVEVSLPSTRIALSIYHLLAPAEASSNLARFPLRGPRSSPSSPPDFFGALRSFRGRTFGSEVKRRLLVGAFCLSAGHREAWYERGRAGALRVRSEYAEVFEKVDLCLGPTTPVPAFPLEDRSRDPLAHYQCDALTVGANLAGLPALSLPCGFDPEGMPVGLHLVGPPGRDGCVLLAGLAYQEGTDWHLRRPSPPERRRKERAR